MSPPRRVSDAPRSRELRPPRSRVVPALGSERRSGEPGGIHGCLWRWPRIIGGRSRRDRGGHPGCSAGPAAALGRTRRSPCGRTSRDTSMPRSGASPSRDPPLRDRSPVPFECRRARPAFMDSTTAYRFFRSAFRGDLGASRPGPRLVGHPLRAGTGARPSARRRQGGQPRRAGGRRLPRAARLLRHDRSPAPGLDAVERLPRAVDRGVAFVPGAALNRVSSGVVSSAPSSARQGSGQGSGRDFNAKAQ